MAKSDKNAESDRNVISFELPAEALDALRADAKSHGSRSHHLRARDIIIDFLSNREIGELAENVAAVDANVAHLIELVRIVEYSQLVHVAGKPSEVANAWIREHMPAKK